MKTTKTIRYIGLGLLILSIILLTYLFSFTVLKDKTAGTADQYAILEISADSAKFPRTDYDLLFSKLNLAADSVQIDTESSAEEQQSQISSAIAGMGSDHVILLSSKDACIPALSASLTNKRVASVILLSPGLAGSNSVESFGTHEPDIPIAIFDVDTKDSASLYERLSGEDATLFPGFNDGGQFLSTVFITPDGSRYLSQWEFPGKSIFGRPVLAFLPQVQIKIGEYIASYIIAPATAVHTDIRSEMAVMQTIKILAVTFMAAGLLLFFASIPRGRRDSPAIDAPSVTPVKVIDPLRRRVLFVSAAAALLFTVVLIILYLQNQVIASTFLAVWPLIYYAACAAILIRSFPASLANTRVPAKRLLFSAFVALLFTTGVYLLSAMYSMSDGNRLTGGHAALVLLFSILLFVLSWVRMSTDTKSSGKSTNENIRTGRHPSWQQQAVLVFPYAAVFLLLLISGRYILFFKCIFLLAAILIGIWLRHIFRRTSGTDWLAAIVFSIFYSLVVFG